MGLGILWSSGKFQLVVLVGFILLPTITAVRGNEPLTRATAQGDLETVQALLQAGALAAGTNPAPIFQTFALAALEADAARPAAIKQLDEIRALLKSSFITNCTPAYVAGLRQQEAERAAKVARLAPDRWQKIQKLLIQHGADYDVFAATALNDTNRLARLTAADKNIAQARDGDGQTPLHWAVRTDRFPLVSFWIQSGVPLNATNSAGRTALHLAAAQGKVEFVKTLLAAHATNGIRDTNGWTPLYAAVRAKQPACIQLLMSKPSPHNPVTTLHEAAARGDVATLAALLQTTTNLETWNELGQTPLQVAVTSGHLAAAALLVDKGADVNMRDFEDNPLLHQIFWKKQYQVYDHPTTNWLSNKPGYSENKMYARYLAKPAGHWSPNGLLEGTCFLLLCGANAQATNQTGLTLVQLAIDEKNTMGFVFYLPGDRRLYLKLLRDAGADLNQRDADGNTPLHLCAQETVTERMTDLIAAGADLNATNKAGQTPLHKFSEKILAWDESISGTNEPFQLLVSSKVNLDAQDNEGRTPLHVLAAMDDMFQFQALKLLLAAGANPNLRDKHGRTPAHIYLSQKWHWIIPSADIEVLAKAGANLSIKDNQGKTPLHYLASLTGENQIVLFELHSIGDTFISAKVDLDARDNHGDTPLMLAGKAKNDIVYAWLLRAGANQDATNRLGQTPRKLYPLTPSIQYSMRLLESVEKAKAQSSPPAQH